LPPSIPLDVSRCCIGGFLFSSSPFFYGYLNPSPPSSPLEFTHSNFLARHAILIPPSYHSIPQLPFTVGDRLVPSPRLDAWRPSPPSAETLAPQCYLPYRFTSPPQPLFQQFLATSALFFALISTVPSPPELTMALIRSLPSISQPAIYLTYLEPMLIGRAPLRKHSSPTLLVLPSF